MIATLPRKVLNSFNCLGAVFGSLDDDIQTALIFSGSLVRWYQLRAAKYAGERVVEIVRHA